MKAIFLERDPLVRGLWHCLAMSHGLAHGLAATPEEARRLLRGEITGRAPLWTGCYGSAPSAPVVMVVNPVLPEEEGDFLRDVRREFPHMYMIAHATPDAIRGGENFDRVFFKPNAEEAVFRAVLGVVENIPEFDLFAGAVDALDVPAA